MRISALARLGALLSFALLAASTTPAQTGVLWAAGRATYGELGKPPAPPPNGGTIRYQPNYAIVADPGFTIAFAAAGDGTTFLVGTDGRLRVTGFNYNGQLGTGTTTSLSTFTPVTIGDGTKKVTAVAPGLQHTLALLEDGTVWATGSNAEGQLGDGTQNPSLVFKQVLTDATFIAAGGWHSLAIKTDGSLWAWGNNYFGQLATGEALAPGFDPAGVVARPTPAQVTSFPVGTPAVTGVSAGLYHTLILTADKQLWAVGSNSKSQLGVAPSFPKTSPIKFVTTAGATEEKRTTGFAAGSQHTVLLRDDGTAWAVGDNEAGQIGTIASTTISTPLLIANGVRRVFARGSSTHYQKTDDSLWAAGINFYGQLGLEPLGTVDNDRSNNEVFAFQLVAGPILGFVPGENHNLLFLPPRADAIGIQPVSQQIAASEEFFVYATPRGLPVANATYQWRRDDTAITGANAAGYRQGFIQTFDAAAYSLVITADGATATSSNADLDVTTLASTARLANLSVRGQVKSGDANLITGFVLSGATGGATKNFLLRAVGPTLALNPLNVTGAITDPTISLNIPGNPTALATNDNWESFTPLKDLTDAFTATGAFSFPPGSKDSALYRSLGDGSYTVNTSPVGAIEGIALAEIYDAGVIENGPRLINISGRGEVGTGYSAYVAGFVVTGTGTINVLIRGVGPTLAAAPFNVTGTLADPVLKVFRGGSLLFTNDNWQTGADEERTAEVSDDVGAFALPLGSKDAAIVLTLPTGAYTVQLSGVGETTGIALAEIYAAP